MYKIIHQIDKRLMFFGERLINTFDKRRKKLVCNFKTPLKIKKTRCEIKVD